MLITKIKYNNQYLFKFKQVSERFTCELTLKTRSSFKKVFEFGNTTQFHILRHLSDKKTFWKSTDFFFRKSNRFYFSARLF